MRALVQRVSRASVKVNENIVGAITGGLVVFLGVGIEDDEEDVNYIVNKVLKLRIFPNQEGKMDRSVSHIGAELMVVSQFTLYADTRKGLRPSFVNAASTAKAYAIIEQAIEQFRASGLRTETGRFQEHMVVELCNDGPVTIMLDSCDKK